MLENLYKKKIAPKRIVIFGSNGFIGKNLINHLKKLNLNSVGVSRKDIDLIKNKSVEQIKKFVKDGDSIIFLSALTPDKGKDFTTFNKNIKMIENFVSGVKNKKLNHLIYFSSDAVYSFDNSLIDENTPTFSSDYYSLMHITREIVIKNETNCPSLFIRPTAVYGYDDTHNSYGPNRFIKNALLDKKIILGGNGEETRDHIFIDDLIKITTSCIIFKTIGHLNAATGFSISFMDLAKIIKKNVPEVNIITTERNNPITYRKFNINNFSSCFSDFAFTDIDSSISSYVNKVK